MTTASASSADSDPRLTEGHRETLIYTDVFFGGFCVYMLIVAGAGWLRGEVTGAGLLALLVFVGTNAVFTQVSIRMNKPLVVELLRPVLGGVICPVAYLLVDGPLAPWWPGYVIMCLGGGIAIGILTEKPFWGRIIVVYYLINITLATLFGIDEPDWYQFLVHAGVIAMCGLMFAQMMSILGRSLKKEHERSSELRDAHAALEEMDRLKSDFFANISHELRTPITLTLGPAEAILSGRHGPIPDAARAPLTVMQNNQLRLLALVNQILDLAKLEEGRMELRAARLTTPCAFIEQRVAQFRALADKRGIDLVARLDGALDEAELYVDPDKLDKILFNLLSNAVKFTERGRIEVIAELSDALLVSVRDTGIGIAEHELEHVFDRFHQADGGERRIRGGTGIGLALVKELARLHGGDVSVKSTLGVGSTFTLRIPLGRDHLAPGSVVDHLDGAETLQPVLVDEHETTVDATTLNARADRMRDPDKATVLYADDNAELRSYVRGLLAGDYNVFVAVDGEHGLELAARVAPDLILSDRMMPRMSGSELCRRVREHEHLRTTPFVMLTAKGGLDAKIEGLEEGADDYLAKPFSPSELLARIHNLILLRRQQRELARAFEELAEKDAILRDDLEQAESFQRSMLPRLVPEDWIDIRAEYRPAGLVGGDIYDVCRLRPGHYRLFLADAVGHGVQASLRTMLIRNEYDRIKKRSRDPARALSELNAALASTPVGLVPACCVDIEQNGKGAVARYANAGHPALCAVIGGKPRDVHRPGPFLGMLDDIELACEELALGRGDRLFAYTDGLYESWNERQEAFGRERVTAGLSAGGSAREAIDEVVAELGRFLGGAEQADDLTVIGVECR